MHSPLGFDFLSCHTVVVSYLIFRYKLGLRWVFFTSSFREALVSGFALGLISVDHTAFSEPRIELNIPRNVCCFSFISR